MRFINLVLFSDSIGDDCYDEMKILTSQYYKTFGDNVKTFYVKYDVNVENVKMENDFLIFKGTETLIPGLTNKTIDAFGYIIDSKILESCDYVVRTNISTIINFDNLKKELEANPIAYYGGGNIMELNWLGGGINDSSYFGTKFVQGTSIILSKKAVEFMYENRDKFQSNIIDDVSMAIFVKDHMPFSYPPQSIGADTFIQVPRFIVDGKIDIQKLRDIARRRSYVFYRNNCIFQNPNRKIDLIHMMIIIEELLKQ